MSTDSTELRTNEHYNGLARVELVLSREQAEEEVDLRQICRIIWRRKWVVVAVTAIFTFASAAVALWLPDEYTAKAMLMPAENDNNSMLSQLANQFGGLTSLAGISLPQTQDRTGIALEVFKSWGFLADFIRQNQLEVPIFAATGWNRADNRLEIDPKLYDDSSHKWVRKFNPAKGETAAPNGWELYKALSRRLSVYQDKQTGLVTLSVEFYSPYIAREWVDELVVAINRQFQLHDREEAQERIRYLEGQLEKTNLKDIKVILSDLIEEQTRTLMMTQVNNEYVLKTVSAARLPEERSSPMRLLICGAGAGSGILLSAIYIVATGRSSRGPRVETT
ncbi:MAG: Wzz/FepE/Etk N-terminal domain-containing protein [Steroidobacteraceae bacterium]